MLIFAPTFTRKVGRVIDRAGLEIRYTLFGYRGFESLTLRQKTQRGLFQALFRCIKSYFYYKLCTRL